MFKHAQLESVKAWIGDPAHGALPLHARIQRAIRHLILDGALDVGRRLPASRALAQSLGVSVLDVAQTLQMSLSGQRFGYFMMNGKQYQVMGQFDRKDRATPMDLASIFVKNSQY